MWRNDRERPDDPQTRERETQRLARDEYERPLYGSPRPQGGASGGADPSQQNQRVSYDRAAWTYQPQPGVSGRFRGDPRALWPQQPRPPQQPQHVQQQPPQRPHQPQQASQREPARQQHQTPPQSPSLDDIRAHEIMTRRVATVHPASSVERVARLMEECDCGAIPVVADNGVLVGMVTDRDITIRVVARGREVRNAIVADCMTEHVFACFANESIAECMRQMAHHKVRRMPIVDERGRLIGIVAQGDLARHSARNAIAEERRALAHVVGEVSQPGHASRR